LRLRYPEQWGKDATKNQSAGALAPSGGDEAAEAALVEQLFELMPPALRRILEKYGVDPDSIVTPGATDEARPLPPPSD
jgi:hypothetical protein